MKITIEPIDNETVPLWYRATMLRKINVRGVVFAGITEVILEKRFMMKKSNTEFWYRVKIHDYKHESNLKGDLWKEELRKLTGFVKVLVNDRGEVILLDNAHEIRTMWNGKKGEIERLFHKDPDHEQMLKGIDAIMKSNEKLRDVLFSDGIYELFFPHIFGEYDMTNPYIQQKEIPQVFYDYGVPLLVSRKISQDFEKNIVVDVAGELDSKNFDDLRVSNFFKRLFDQYNLLASDVKVDYFGSYELDKNNFLSYGGYRFSAFIKGVFHQEHTCSFELIQPLKPFNRYGG